MWLRYPVAILTAYGVFLMLLGIWLWLQRHSLDVDLDLPTLDFTPSTASGPGESLHFGGGDAGGGGAGGSWGESVSSSTSATQEKIYKPKEVDQKARIIKKPEPTLFKKTSH